MKTEAKNKGFISAIILVIIALVILGYYKIDVRDIVDGPIVKDNLNYGVETGIKLIGSFRTFVISFITQYLHH